MEKAQVGAIQLVEAGENAAKVLEFVDAAFDQMALPVEPGIIRALDGGALMRWDDRDAAARLKMGDERRACVATIRHDLREGQPVEQRLSLRAVMALAGRQEHPYGIA